MNQTNVTVYLISSALFLWAAGIGIGNYTSSEPTRKLHANKGGAAESSTRGSDKSSSNFTASTIHTLETQSAAAPEDIKVKLALANAYFDEGIQGANSEYLKRAAGLFYEISETDPTSADALIGLATLSLHVGVSEKAVEYYSRYLELSPNDLGAKSNLALAKARLGDVDGALQVLDDVKKIDSKFVIGLVTRGLIYKESGDLTRAKTQLEEALVLESSDFLKSKISELINSLDAVKAPLTNSKSSIGKEGDLVENYFKTHDILSKKLVSVTQVTKGKYLVELKDFPITAMPEIARQKFTASLKHLLLEANALEIQLLSHEDKKILAVVSGT